MQQKKVFYIIKRRGNVTISSLAIHNDDTLFLQGRKRHARVTRYPILK